MQTPIESADCRGMTASKAGRWVLGAMFLAGTLTMLGGCYERVVGARGLGADQYKVSEPYQENSKIDDWIFGEQKRDPHTPR
jgi:hypothetical protein